MTDTESEIKSLHRKLDCDYINKITQGDALEMLKKLDDNSVDCCITSPPYWNLRDYNVEGQLGLEKTPEEYVAKLVGVFREVRRVLKKEGTCWLNLGDSYAGSGQGWQKEGGSSIPRKWLDESKNYDKPPGYISSKQENGLKPKDLVGILWRVAFALQADGWYLRQDIIWSKPNPMPESVTDRCTKSHEYIFLLAKSQHYFYNNEAIKEPANYDGRKDTMMKGSDKYKLGYVPNQNPQTVSARGHERWNKNEQGEYVRNRRSVWVVNTQPFKDAHFATFPEMLIEPMVKAGCPEGGIIIDPFMGSGTTAVVARKLGRHFIGFDLNPAYCEMATKRVKPFLEQKRIFEGEL